MLVTSLFIIMMAVALSNTSINPILLTRMCSLVLLYTAALSYNALDLQGIGEGVSIYSGLFQVTSVSQSVDTFIFIIGAMILVPWAPIINNLQSRSTVFTAVPTITTYPIIILFTTCGASFLISSADLVSVYLSIELQSFAVYILATLYRDSDSATAAGLKYFLLGGLSSALILLGSALIYGYTGLTNLENIYTLLSVSETNEMNLCAIGLFIFVIGFLFKISAAPFHNWAPDVYDGVPTIVTTWLTIMPKLSILILLLEVQAGVAQSFDVWTNLLLVSSLLSLVIGTVVGLAQTRIKRLLAYSTISHVGFLLLALGVNTEESIESFLFYLVQYSVTNLNAFMIILAFGYVMHSSVSRSSGQNTDLQLIIELAGQFRSNPILGLSLTVCLFSMAGVPPLMGFFAKQTVLYSATHSGYYFLSIVAILVSVVSAYYYLKIVRVIHFDTPSSEILTVSSPVQKLSSVHSFAIATLTMIIALFAVYPNLILNSTTLLALTLYGY
ncbi:NADH-quinone oxidoreductase subunit NuoN [Prescottella soli]